jgi:hypothetical protein
MAVATSAGKDTKRTDDMPPPDVGLFATSTTR